MSNDVETVEVVSVHSSKPISINSDSHNSHSPVFVRYLYKNDPCQANGNDETITLSSQPSLKCPVSWTQVHKPANNFLPNHVQTFTPSPHSKVNSWLQEKKSSILIRHDFGKDFTISKCSSVSPNNIASPTVSSERCSNVSSKHNVYKINTVETPSNKDAKSKFEIESTSGSSPKMSALTLTNYMRSKEFHKIFVNNVESKDKVENNSAKPQTNQKFSDNTIPLSPESQKKKELCSYLQLMNMETSTKKERITVQNRRSTRVKNYMLLTEKKDLERKLNFDTQTEEKKAEKVEQQSRRTSTTDSTCSSIELPIEEPSLSRKSFKELQMDSDKSLCRKEPDINLKAIENTLSTESDVSNFAEFIPKKLMEKQENFEDTIKKFFVNERINYKKGMPKCKKDIKNCDKPKLKRGRPRKDEKRFDKLRNKENIIKKQKYKKKKLINQVSKIFKNHNKKKKLKQFKKQLKLQNGRILRKNIFNTLKSNNNSIRPLFRSPMKRHRSLRSTDSLEHIGLKTILDKSLKKGKRMYRRRENHTKTEEHEEKVEKQATIIEELQTDISRIENENEELNHNTSQQVLMDHDYILLDEEIVEKEPESPVTVGELSDTVNATNLNGPKNDTYCPCSPKQGTFDNVDVKLTCTTINSNNGAKNNTLLSPCFGFNQSTSSNVSLAKIDTMINALHSNITEQETELLEKDINQSGSRNEIVDCSRISPCSSAYIALNTKVKIKSLHRNLIPSKSTRKRLNFNSENDTEDTDDWDMCSTPSIRSQKSEKRSSQSHSINLSKDNGTVLKAYYIDFNLIIAQEFMVSFWSQSALGNVLGAQNMWIPKGQINRLVLDNGCVHKSSSEMVLSSDNSVAYVELWTKEHKSDKRERPVADVFATVYFCKQRQNGVFKKVLQLENIHG